MKELLQLIIIFGVTPSLPHTFEDLVCFNADFNSCILISIGIKLVGFKS
jgi:hypothetical protein